MAKKAKKRGKKYRGWVGMYGSRSKRCRRTHLMKCKPVSCYLPKKHKAKTSKKAAKRSTSKKHRAKTGGSSCTQAMAARAAGASSKVCKGLPKSRFNSCKKKAYHLVAPKACGGLGQSYAKARHKLVKK